MVVTDVPGGLANKRNMKKDNQASINQGKKANVGNE